MSKKANKIVKTARQIVEPRELNNFFKNYVHIIKLFKQYGLSEYNTLGEDNYLTEWEGINNKGEDFQWADTLEERNKLLLS